MQIRNERGKNMIIMMINFDDNLLAFDSTFIPNLGSPQPQINSIQGNCKHQMTSFTTDTIVISSSSASFII